MLHKLWKQILHQDDKTKQANRRIFLGLQTEQTVILIKHNGSTAFVLYELIYWDVERVLTSNCSDCCLSFYCGLRDSYLINTNKTSVLLNFYFSHTTTQQAKKETTQVTITNRVQISYFYVKMNRIYHRSPMLAEKSQPEGKRMMPETSFTEFPA